MKLLTCIMPLFIPLFIHAQEYKGVKFEQGLSWQQILNKAKSENKYVFVDAYASWCGPCKAMDKNIYPSEKIREYVNKKFVSVKVQMDTTEKDNESVKSWYRIAKEMSNSYQIHAFPTYLFFLPNGKVIHRDLGSKSINDFIDMAREACYPNTQYYTMIEHYKQGRLDIEKVPQLANITQKLGNKELAYSIAAYYKKNFLDTVSGIKLFQYENFVFLNNFGKLITADGSSGRLFKFFYYYKDSADKIAKNNGFATYYVKAIITMEEINSVLWKNGRIVTRKPDWNKIYNKIRDKYNEYYAESLVFAAQLNFYRQLNDWKFYANLIDGHIGKRSSFSDFKGLGFNDWEINGLAWDVFKYCNDKTVLLSALRWSELSISLLNPLDPNEQYYDTKANLLYKLGRVKEAIEYEEKALKLNEIRCEKNGNNPNNSPLLKEYKEVVEQMRKGEPTYLSEGAVWP